MAYKPDPVPTPLSSTAPPPAPKAEAPKAAAKLAPASSGTPDIQYLVALRHTHYQNGNEDGVKAITQQLADLGYE